ncbi:MAG: glycosyltransferase family 2 protein [Armatimonadetes bacterium]|nr:glycosyltransferase family 2 protein [Armatimonadota bacterium]
MSSTDALVSVSVIIVNWNTRALLAKAITSARQWAGRQTVETIVVDNASTDGSAEMVRALYSNAQLIANARNVGYTKAGNQGLAQAQGRYALFLHADAELTRGCLDELVRVMDAHPDIGACSPAWDAEGQTVPAGVYPRLGLRMLPTERNRQIENRMVRACRRDAECYDVEWIVGAVLLVRREVIAQIGGMEERLFMWYDDVDWCRRMQRRGWRRVIVPGAYARHEHGASVAQVPSLQSDFRMTMAEYTYWRLHKGRVLTAILYFTRVARLGSRWAFMVMWNLFCRNRDPKVKQALRLAAARFGWHVKHGVDVLLRQPRAYRGE